MLADYRTIDIKLINNQLLLKDVKLFARDSLDLLVARWYLLVLVSFCSLLATFCSLLIGSYVLLVAR